MSKNIKSFQNKKRVKMHRWLPFTK